MPGPARRWDPAMATLDGEIVLFGGQDETSYALGDTWTWDGTSWAKQDVSGPPARFGAAMAAIGAQSGAGVEVDAGKGAGQAWDAARVRDGATRSDAADGLVRRDAIVNLDGGGEKSVDAAPGG